VSQDLVFIPIKNEGGREGGELCGLTVILLDVNGKISLQFVCAVCFSLFLIWVFPMPCVGPKVPLPPPSFFGGRVCRWPVFPLQSDSSVQSAAPGTRSLFPSVLTSRFIDSAREARRSALI
jgi:hypothetical protein